MRAVEPFRKDKILSEKSFLKKIYKNDENLKPAPWKYF